MVQKKNKPKFNVLNLGFFKSVKARWRRPRGTHNKKRMKFKWTGAMPRIGYRNPLELRGLHSSGMKEVLVNNLKEVEGLKDVVVRIAAAVGAKKRKVIEEKAKALHLRVVNPLGSADKKKGEVKFVRSKKPKKAPSQHVAPAAHSQHGAVKKHK